MIKYNKISNKIMTKCTYLEEDYQYFMIVCIMLILHVPYFTTAWIFFFNSPVIFIEIFLTKIDNAA